MTSLSKTSVLLLIILLTPICKLEAQKKQALIDLFYQALKLTEQDSLVRESGQFYDLSLSDYEYEEISPASIIKKFPDAKKYLLNDSIMLFKPYLEIQGLIEDLSITDPKVTIKNFHFQNDVLINLNLYGQLEEEVFNASRLTYENCVFKKGLQTWFTNFFIIFQGNSIQKLNIINETVISPYIFIINNDIGYLTIWTAAPKNLLISNNRIGVVEIDRTECYRLEILNNIFHLPKTLGNDWISTIKQRQLDEIRAFGGISDPDSIRNFQNQNGGTLFNIHSTSKQISNLSIKGNQFLDDKNEALVIFNQVSQNMEVVNNNFEVPIIMRPVVANRFILESNALHKINMEAAIPSTPQNYVKIDWQDLKGNLYWQENEGTPAYDGSSDQEMGDKRRFFDLIAGYSRLLEVYKSYGNLDDANDVFLDMKALHLKRFKYLYKTEGGTTNFFQLNLNRLLRVYTRHGTDPAQAMTASLWIIIFFSFIYFFFPSDWDVSSKSKMMADFKNFIEKNEKGYFNPFLKLLKGLVSSFFNAVTLSVNSFVTLGFGTIPTRGLAKYICIFQGFLGWFLLSIFIVALINQILV